MKKILNNKIDTKTLLIGVVGLGYVGLPLAVEKAKAGFKTIGFDVNIEKVKMVNKGTNYIGDVVDDDLKTIVENGLLSATNDFSFVKEVDFIAICVPSPLDTHKQPDLSYIINSSIEIAKHLKKGSAVVLESTTYPGTTKDLILPLIEKYSGLKCGKGFYLGFSPERVDPGNKIYKTKNTPKVVGAVTNDGLEIISKVYKTVLNSEVHTVSSPTVAEMEKILENTYRNVNIGLVNELAILCDKMNVNIWEVIEAAKSKPYGFQAFYPGPGLGGHCIPLDPYYLTWKAKEFGFHTSMIESSMMINDRMPEYCSERAAKILNRFKKPVNGSNILVLGVAYKQDINDFRESPAIRLIDELENLGAKVDFYDPYISEYNRKGNIKKGLIELKEKMLSSVDLVIVATAHTNIDYNFVQEKSKIIFDTKNALKSVLNRSNIELL